MAHIYNSDLVSRACTSSSSSTTFAVAIPLASRSTPIQSQVTITHRTPSPQDAFELYHQVQEARLQREESNSPSLLKGPALPALGHAVAGSCGAALSNLATYPLNLIITRLQIQRQLANSKVGSSDDDKYQNIWDAARKIYRDEGGLAGLYTGIGQDTGKTIADSFLFFLVYTFLRQYRLEKRGASSASAKSLPVGDELAVGFVAGSFTKLFTTPLSNIVTRKQTSALLSKSKSRTEAQVAEKDLGSIGETDASNTRFKPTPKTPSTREIAAQIHAEKGLSGFWSGYSAALVLTLNPSLTFFFYETLKRVMLTTKAKREKPPPVATFLLAAVSKALASTITYPFSLAKARAQAMSKKDETGDTSVEHENLIETLKRWRKRTVFYAVLQIASQEGLSALYEGLSGEVLKGFFNHGITMMIKEAIHKFIVHAYYIALITLKQYPSPEELMERAKLQASEFAQATQDAVEEAKQQGTQIVSDVQLSIGNLAETAKESASVRTEQLWHAAHETAEYVHDYVEEESAEWQSLYDKKYPWDEE